MKEGPIEIREVEWGLANHFGNYIEVHKDLKKYRVLYNYVIGHELKHSPQDWSMKDFLHDAESIPWNVKLQLYKFMLKRPKTWIQILPIYYQKSKGIVIDWSMVVGYIFFITLIIIIIIFLNRFFVT